MSLEIEDAKLLLNNILSEWDHFSTHLQNLTKEELKDDLFSQIDYLTQLEEVNARISAQLSEFEERLEKINTSGKSCLSKEESLKSDLLNLESLQILKLIQPKLQMAEETYNEMAEEVLGRSQDLINHLVDKILEHPQRGVSLKDKIGLELDEEIQLRELEDSLGAYKESRLENMKEEDDLIIDQIDSQMLACSEALQTNES
jgi:hypothetical protein